jgi:hypothetical protein
MTKADPLIKLHALAEWTRHDPAWAASHGQFPYISHGIAAVRAMRAMTPSTTYEIFCRNSDNADRAYAEAKLAFRSALSAVGLKTL